ncbi:hypothetical protein O3G_MSEX000844 [Manduca sexta]|nr:hypothetical protein O3G_MSEX000844 [Manduca sexta]
MDLSNFNKTPIITLTRLPTPVPAGEAELRGRKSTDGILVEECVGEKPAEVVAEFVRPYSNIEVDSESSESVSSVRSRMFWRRYSRSKDSRALTTDTNEPAPKTVTTDGRGRGRPPSIGKYVGLKKAQKELDARRREQARRRMEEETEGQRKKEKPPVAPKPMDVGEDRVISKEDLLHCGQVVRQIVRKSVNLKGTSQKALNYVTDTIKQYVVQPESARADGTP